MAMTDNPDFSSEQTKIAEEKQKLDELEERLDELMAENEELTDQIGPMLRGEIDCDPQQLGLKIAQLKEKMDEDHNEINDFDEELEVMRVRWKDARLVEIIAVREKERGQLKMRLQMMRDKRRALSDKLKHQEEFCDLPGELDDLIR